MEDIAGDGGKAQEVLTEILLKQAETLGFTQHPYQRMKRMTGEGVLDHAAELWHCKHMRKYGSTLTCPFRCTAQCVFKIKYQFKNCRLKVYTVTLGEHSHWHRSCLRWCRQVSNGRNVFEACLARALI